MVMASGLVDVGRQLHRHAVRLTMPKITMMSTKTVTATGWRMDLVRWRIHGYAAMRFLLLRLGLQLLSLRCSCS